MQTMRFFLLLFFVASFFLFGEVHAPTLRAQEPERVEILIRNSAYEIEGGTLPPGVPAVLVLRNLDKVEHGFVSLLFQEMDARVEVGGSATFGRGIKGVHIAPGAEVKILFIPPRAGKFTFVCDLHPNMKGEILLLSIGAA